jgi:predicted heme/steroid binding protein
MINSVFFKTLVILCLMASTPVGSQALEEYAEETGAKCEVCHLDPSGGGDFTERGKGYYLSVDPEAALEETPPKSISQILRLVIGYVHIVTAFLWFGTILYVHLVLKPAYASKGLPRGEVKVGLVSMVMMAVTGSVLTYFRIPSLSHFVSSKFGILLLTKISVFSIMVLSAIFVVLVIGPKLRKKQILKPSLSGELTLAELSGFDGQEGRPAYFAYKGKVYDVSQSSLWMSGNHMQRHQAGFDLTDILPQAPHAEDKILVMPEVGLLSKEKKDQPVEVHKQVFFFMAYMNLGFVFVITLILALWRWY